jgi:hypothetical protein
MARLERLRWLRDNPLPLAVLVQGCLLFYRLDLLPVWGDEQFTLDVIQRPWTEIPRILRGDIHPPIYYFLAKLWIGMPWPGELITQVRALSVVICLAATVVIYRLWLRDAEPATRCWFLALWAISPTLVMYSRMARSYSLQVLVGMAALFVAMRFLEAPADRKRLAAYVVAASALLYTHYLPGLAVAGATGLFLLAAVLKNKSREAIHALVFSSLGIVLLYGPWLRTLLRAIRRVPGADPYMLIENAWLETVIKLTYLFTSFSFGEAFPIWSVAMGALLGPGVIWLLWHGARERERWMPHALTGALIAYLGAAAWVAFPFVGARMLFFLPLYLLWLLKGRARKNRVGAVICGGMLVVSLGSLSSYYARSNFLNQGYLVPFGEIAALIHDRSSPSDTMVLADGYNTDPAPLLAAVRGKFGAVRIRDEGSRAQARALIESTGWRKIWFLRNSHDISPNDVISELEAFAAQHYESDRHVYVPFSPMDRWVARWLGRSEASHHYQMTEFTQRAPTR